MTEPSVDKAGINLTQLIFVDHPVAVLEDSNTSNDRLRSTGQYISIDATSATAIDEVHPSHQSQFHQPDQHLAMSQIQ